MSKMKIKIIAGVLVVFLLGVITGALGTGHFIKRRFQEFSSGERPFHKFFMRRLTRELELTDEQKLEVQKILEDSAGEVREFLQNSRIKFDKIMARRTAEIKEILTPDQQKQLDQMHEKIKKRWHIPPPHKE